jgi:hypothetical protein
MRKPKACNMKVGDDGEPRGLIVGFRPGIHPTSQGPMRVVKYVPVPEKRRPKRPR